MANRVPKTASDHYQKTNEAIERRPAAPSYPQAERHSREDVFRTQHPREQDPATGQPLTVPTRRGAR